jgi:hypothetical protein
LARFKSRWLNHPENEAQKHADPADRFGLSLNEQKIGNEVSLPDTQGLRLISNGLAFLKAAKLLHDTDPEEFTWAPCFVNLGLAIELGLKGFLREQGMLEAEQKGIAHDLIKAFEASLTCGFRPTYPLQSQLIDALNPHYKDMSLRYQIGTSVELPLLRDAIVVTESLTFALYDQSTAKYV